MLVSSKLEIAECCSSNYCNISRTCLRNLGTTVTSSVTMDNRRSNRRPRTRTTKRFGFANTEPNSIVCFSCRVRVCGCEGMCDESFRLKTLSSAVGLLKEMERGGRCWVGSVSRSPMRKELPVTDLHGAEGLGTHVRQEHLPTYIRLGASWPHMYLP